MAAFGVLGYLFARLACEPAPLLLGFILGPMMEEYLRRALLISRGDASVFFRRPMSAVLLVLAVIALLGALSPRVRRGRAGRLPRRVTSPLQGDLSGKPSPRGSSVVDTSMLSSRCSSGSSRQCTKTGFSELTIR